MQFYSLTDKGMLREINEDYFLSEKAGDYTILILADGMGGHNGGETASKIAGEIIFEHLNKKLKKSLLPGQIMLMLSEALEKANEHILAISKKNIRLAGMGTTADVLVFRDNAAYIAHIGDGRIYSLAPGEDMKLLTKDHSLVEYMIETGALTREQAEGHPQKNIITKALGISSEISADIFHVKAEKGTRLLMCSDGLTNMVRADVIAEVISSCKTLEDGACALVKLANDAGGNDNITVILAQA